MMARILLGLVLLGGCQQADEPARSSPASAAMSQSKTWIDDQVIASADPGQWPAYGHDFKEQRYVTSRQINRDTIADLGLAYRIDIGTRLGSLATPLLVDGMLIFPTVSNIVVAVDAKTGEGLWRYDPMIDMQHTRFYTASASRGVAAYEDKVIIATQDGRLIAVGLHKGEKIWEADTFDGGNCRGTVLPACYISGAPRVAKGKVFIGFGGAEFNARGYMSAYDVSTGELVWRFYTVPRDPENPEHPEMEAAAKTWSEGWWKDGLGGGGTVWDSMVFDEDFDQLIIGTGNAGSAYPRHIRSPTGGDNLYLASIIALDIETGRMKWYYQQVPGEQWDYTATQSLILADLTIDGVPRKVVMQAPKNGFFYVLDRSDGELLSAGKFAIVTWADRVDMETGRPVETVAADYARAAAWLYPAAIGANNWQPMAFNPETGLAYISAREGASIFAVDKDIRHGADYQIRPGVSNPGIEFRRVEELLAEAGPPPGKTEGFLKAYDPVATKLVWQKPMRHGWNSGVLTTAGGLVFIGDAMGFLEAYDAVSGEVLWSFNTYKSLLAPPISYTLDGEQFVALLAGTRTGPNVTVPSAAYLYGNEGQLLVFKLGGQRSIDEPPLVDRSTPRPPTQVGSSQDIELGDRLYHRHCVTCHGVGASSSGIVPDLRKMSPSTHNIFNGIVVEGWLESNGMLGFGKVLSDQQSEQIRAYLIQQAHQLYQQESQQ